MSNAEMLREPEAETLRAGTVDMKLEVVVIPVSDNRDRHLSVEEGESACRCDEYRAVTASTARPR